MSTIVEALRPRAHIIAEVLGERLPSSVWAGYQRNEPLRGLLMKSDEVMWRRYGHGDANPMYFGFLKVRGIDARSTGDTEVISSDVIERHEDNYVFEKPIKYTHTLSHTFSKTTTLEEAKKEAWEVAAKANFSISYSGVSGGVEASAKYGQELSRKAAQSETTSDTVTRAIEIQGPVELRWVAERSTDTLLRKYAAVPDLDFKLYWRTDDSAWEWTSYADVFVPAAKGEAPVDQSYSIYSSSSPSHDLFNDNPVPPEQIKELELPLANPIPFSAEYQTVTRQSIKAI